MHDPVTTRVMLILNLYRLHDFVFVVEFFAYAKGTSNIIYTSTM